MFGVLVIILAARLSQVDRASDSIDANFHCLYTSNFIYFPRIPEPVYNIIIVCACVCTNAVDAAGRLLAECARAVLLPALFKYILLIYIVDLQKERESG